MELDKYSVRSFRVVIERELDVTESISTSNNSFAAVRKFFVPWAISGRFVQWTP